MQSLQRIATLKGSRYKASRCKGSGFGGWRHTVVALLAVAATTGHAQAPQRRVIQVTAERFAFTPSEITVEAGEQIELRLSSDDTAHGFRIAGVPVNAVIPKRGRGAISVTFTAPEPGRHTFECSRMCGAGHNFMRGVLIVRERANRSVARPF